MIFHSNIANTSVEPRICNQERIVSSIIGVEKIAYQYAKK